MGSAWEVRRGGCFRPACGKGSRGKDRHRAARRSADV